MERVQRLHENFWITNIDRQLKSRFESGVTKRSELVESLKSVKISLKRGPKDS